MKLNLSYRYRSQLFDFLYVQIEQYGAFAFDSLTMDDADRLLETACEIAEVTAEEFEVTDLVIGLIGWSVLLEGASTGYDPKYMNTDELVQKAPSLGVITFAARDGLDSQLCSVTSILNQCGRHTLGLASGLVSSIDCIVISGLGFFKQRTCLVSC